MSRAPQVRLPELVGPVVAPVSASGEFAVGRNFADLGRALESVGQAVIVGGRAATAREVAAGRLEKAQFDTKVAGLKLSQDELDMARRGQKREIDLALSEQGVKTAAERLVAQEEHANVIKARIGEEQARQQYDELRDREALETLGFLRYADPMEGLSAALQWKWLDPARRAGMLDALANQIAEGHLLQIDQKRAQDPDGFSFTKEYESLLTGQMAGVPNEVAGPWSVRMTKELVSRQRQVEYRAGNRRQEAEENKSAANMVASMNDFLHEDGIQTSSMLDMVEAAKSYALMTGQANEENVDKWVEAELPFMLYDEFKRAAISATESGGRDPRAFLDKLGFDQIPGIDALWESEGGRIGRLMDTLSTTWLANRDAKLKDKATKAIGGRQFKLAGQLISQMGDPSAQKEMGVKLGTAMESGDRELAMSAMLIKMIVGNQPIAETLNSPEEANSYYDKWIAGANRLGIDNPVGEYVRAMLWHGKLISGNSQSYYKGLIRGGHIAVVGKELIPAFTQSPAGVKTFLRGMGDEGRWMYAAMVANSIHAGNDDWALEMNSVNIEPERAARLMNQAAELHLKLKQQYPNPRVMTSNGTMKTVPMAFEGKEQSEWFEHYQYNFVKLIDGGKFLDKPMEAATHAAQKASDAMQVGNRNITVDGKGMMAPTSLYGNNNSAYRELELQLNRATKASTGGFGSGDNVQFHPSAGVRLPNNDVYVPGYSRDGGADPVAWYRWSPGFKTSVGISATSFMGPSLVPSFQGQLSGKSIEAIEDNIFRSSEFGELARLQDFMATPSKTQTLTKPERDRITSRIKNLAPRTGTIEEVLRRHLGSNEAENGGFGYRDRFSMFIGGPDVTVADYNKRMSTASGKVFSAHGEVIRWATEWLTDGVWSEKTAEWQAHQLNYALRILQYPAQFQTTAEEMARYDLTSSAGVLPK